VAFNSTGPCSRLGPKPTRFEYAGNGDLVDIPGKQPDGEELLALSEAGVVQAEVQRAKLRIAPLHTMSSGVEMPKRLPTIEFGEMWAKGETPSQNQERWGNHWMAWMYWIFTLEEAARMIGEQAYHYEERKGYVVMPAVLAVRAMLLGYAIECAMKCYWLRSGNRIIENGKFKGVTGAGADHNLVHLGKIVGFTPTQREADVLSRVSKFIRFAGRYPVAKRPDDMTPREVDGLGKIDIGFFSKADFRTCLSMLNKLMTLISGKKRRTFQPLGTLHYLVRPKSLRNPT
jgi:hypothetical protein